MYTVLLLEDQGTTRRWLSNLITKAIGDCCVIEAATVEQGRVLLQNREDIELAIIDLHLPDGSGVELITEIHHKLPDAQIVVATIFDDDEHLFTALRAGAQGYLLKDQPEAQLINMLHGVLHGEPPLSPAVAWRILNYFSSTKTNSSDTSPLSGRESDVLTLITKGLHRREIAAHLGITDNTTAGYIKKIYQKLNISSRAEASLEAVRLGLVNTSCH